MNHDQFVHYDAAYVLGALDARDRQAFEEHLEVCPQCSRAVRELAGLPGLLAKVELADVESPAPQEQVPDTLLPALLREVRGDRARRRTRTLVAVAAAAAVVATGTAVVTNAWDASETTTTSPPPSASAQPLAGRDMAQVGQRSLSATLGMEEVPWGTRLSITCTYAAAARYKGEQAPAYSLVVHMRGGREEQVATWRAVPGRATTVVGATAARAADIVSVEVHTTQGDPVLRLST